MRHPFELNINELKDIDLKIEEISNQHSEQIAGGCKYTTYREGEEGGVTSFSLEEEGGATTQAIGEEGGDIDPIKM